ncbi:MAG: hypothetical protein R3C03_19870 [Pirellulaceae bacterium]
MQWLICIAVFASMVIANQDVPVAFGQNSKANYQLSARALTPDGATYSRGGYQLLQLTFTRLAKDQLGEATYSAQWSADMYSGYGNRESSRCIAAEFKMDAGQQTATIPLLVPNQLINSVGWGAQLSVHRGANRRQDSALVRMDADTVLSSRNSFYEHEFLFAFDKLPIARNEMVVLDKMNAPGNQWFEQSIPAEVDADLPTLSALSEAIYGYIDTNAGQLLIPKSGAKNPAWDVESFAAKNNTTACRLEDLPENWLGLTNVDVLLLSQQDFETLAEISPLKLQAISKWCAVGGRLLLANGKTDLANSNGIVDQLVSDATLEMQSRKRPDWVQIDSEKLAKAKQEHQKHLDENHDLIVESRTQSNRYYGYRSSGSYYDVSAVDKTISDYLPANSESRVTEFENVDSEHGVVATQFGNGRLIIAKREMSEFSKDDWLNVLAAMNLNDNRIFTNIAKDINESGFGVRGVGNPPKKLFLILICFFALAIGPVAIFVLRRMKRTNLILVVVPLFSISAAIGLLLYGVYADGLAFRQIVIDRTWLDGRTGYCAVDRNTYVFSGTNPVAYSVPADVSVDLSSRSQRGIVARSNGDTVQLQGGGVQARVHHSVKTFDLVPMNKGLEFSIDSSRDLPSDGKISVKNNLEVDLTELFINHKNITYHAKNVGRGKTVVLTPALDITPHEASVRLLREILNEIALNTQERATTNIFGASATPFGYLERPGTFWAVSSESLIDRELKPDSIDPYRVNVIHGNW